MADRAEKTPGTKGTPEVWSPCRGDVKGEQRLARSLQGLETERLILCFSVDFIPGCREIDLLLIHRDIGLFIVEVKAIPLRAITSVSPNSWHIEGRASDENPLRQAYKQWEGLRSYWCARTSVKLPPVGVTACFPQISRHEWRLAFPEGYAASLADGMLFSEDLVGAAALKRRLSMSIASPPIRSGRPPGPSSAPFIDRFKALFAPTPPLRPSVSDRERLKQIERSINAQLRGEFPAEGTEYAVFSGAPGTGKTFRLLSIGLHHAYSKKQVLFVCFNKTLASDIRRLLSFEENLKHVEHEMDVLDVNQLAGRCFEMNRLQYFGGGSPDEWGRMVVESLEASGDTAVIAHYDTVLVDEAQDMHDSSEASCNTTCDHLLGLRPRAGDLSR
ncbi:MAG: NERD domain-containing protein [Gammaproteobacteria bacterium]